MTQGGFFGQIVRRLGLAAAIFAGVSLTTALPPAHADGISPGAAVGLGLGSFALGSALANPYYRPYYPYGSYGYYYPPAVAYYPPPPYYPPPRSCWDPYYRYYYPC